MNGDPQETQDQDIELTEEDPSTQGASKDQVDQVTVGRTVHYVAFGTPGGEYPAGACRAALVTEVHDTTAEGKALQQVGLAVFNPTGFHWREFVSWDGTKKPGTWHFPEKPRPR